MGRNHASDSAREKAALSLGPVLEAAHAEGFDTGLAPIGQATFKRIQQRLAEVYADRDAPSPLRRRALEALAHAPRDGLAEAIRAAHRGARDWRVTALRCMFYHDGFETEILASLDSADLEIRAAAIRAVGPCELQEAWTYIEPVLREEPSQASTPLLLAAIESAGLIRPDAALRLLEPLTSDRREDVARAARRGLAFVQWPLIHVDFGDDVRPN